MTLPTLILAFADYRTDSTRHLRELDEEQHQLRRALKPIEGKLCRVEVVAGASVEKIVEAFDEAPGPVVGFHFAGHADGYQLFLRESADGPAFAAFLGKQKDLKFVFLNACSTRGHVEELHSQGTPVVLATSNSIFDEMARQFAVSFYTQLARGKSVQAAYRYFETIEDIKYSRERGVKFHQGEEQDFIQFPWMLECRTGAEANLEWNLPLAARDPLFGLPPVSGDLPEEPFRYLERFERRHARVFFGRSYQIREVYDKVADPLLAPLVLLYGQSGVGKSSLLEAGLLPRLEQDYAVCYVRRSESGLESDLLKELKTARPEEAPTAWKAIEQTTGKPLIVIVDQVEEVFTKPLPENSAEELPNFLKLLRDTFLHPDQRPQGKIILSYRKEYHPDLQVMLRAFTLPHTDVFLQKLDHAGIQDAITCLATKEDLFKQYGLVIADERLPEIIADDLLEDAASAIAPVLQILLTKMWEEATKINKAHPVFSIELYQRKKREGYLLYDFLHQKIHEIARWNREAVDSGLVLDLLMFHTTPRSTANRRRLDEILTRYAHQKNIIQELVLQIRDRYLLVDVHSAGMPEFPDFVLAHDTLAPLVREEYEKSDRPGQLAERILSSHYQEWKREAGSALLDETSLQIVQSGRNGMRVWMVDEERLVEESRLRIEKDKRFRRRVRIGALVSVLTLLVFGGLFWLQRRESVRQAYEIRSNQLIDEGQNLLSLDPTQALKLIYSGWQMDTADLLKSNIFFSAYRENVFYDSLVFREAGGALNQAAFRADGQYFATAAGSTARLYAYRQGKIEQVAEFKNPKNTISALAFSPDGQFLFGGALDRNVYRWSLADGKVDSFFTPRSLDWRAVEAIAVSPDNRRVAIGYEGGGIAIWNPSDTSLNRRLQKPGRVRALAFLPSGAAFLAGAADGTVQQIGINGEAGPAFAAATSAILSLELAPGGDALLVATEDDFSIWRRTDQQGWERKFIHRELPFPLRMARLAASGQLILTAGNSPVGQVWNAENGRLLRELRGHLGNLRAIDADPAANYVFTASEDSTVRRWLLPFDLPRRRFQPGSYLYATLAPVLIDEQTLAAGTIDGQVVLVNIASGKEVLVHEAHQPASVSALVFEPKKSLLISGDQNGGLQVWRLTATSFENVRSDSLHPAAIRALALDPAGVWVASASDDSTAVLYRLETGEKVALRGHRQEVMDVAFSADGKVLLTASLDQTARSWRVPDGRPLERYEHAGQQVISLAARPDGGVFTGTLDPKTNGGRLHVWSAGDPPQQIRTYPLAAAVEALNWQPGNRLLLMALADGSVQVRDAQGNLLRLFKEPGGGAYAMKKAVMAPDQKQFISLNSLAELLFWNNERLLPEDFFRKK